MPTLAPRILIADEQPLVVWALRRTLVARGAQVVTATFHDETCDLLRSDRFDGVVLSCQLADVDMSDVIVEIDRLMPDVRLVALCRGGCADRLQARLERGTVIDSPFEIEEVHRALIPAGCEPVLTSP